MTTSTLESKVKEVLARKMGGTTAPPAPKTPAKEPATFIKSRMDKVGKRAASGYVKYSELFGQVPPSGNDWDVKVFADSDWDEDDKVFIPNKEKFDDYVINHAVMEQLIVGYNANMKMLVVGPTGSGKTSLQELLCAYINQPYYRINGRQDMETDTLLGKPWVSEGSMHYEKGELPKALKKGWYVAFDEPWKTPAGIQMALQRFYEKDGILQLDDMPGSLADKQVISDPRTRLVLSDNVVGTGDGADQYGATMIQDGSTLNRMDMVIKMPYMNQAEEATLIRKKHPAISKDAATKMVKFFNLVRTSYTQRIVSAAVSPRNYDAWANLATKLNNLEMACKWTVLERYAEDSEKAVVRDHYKTVFGKVL